MSSSVCRRSGFATIEEESGIVFGEGGGGPRLMATADRTEGIATAGSATAQYGVLAWDKGDS